MNDLSNDQRGARPQRKPAGRRGFALSETRDADIIVSDLSYEGCGIESGETFEPGERVELRIPGLGGAEAEIRWSAEGKAGAKFVS